MTRGQRTLTYSTSAAACVASGVRYLSLSCGAEAAAEAEGDDDAGAEAADEEEEEDEDEGGSETSSTTLFESGRFSAA